MLGGFGEPVRVERLGLPKEVSGRRAPQQGNEQELGQHEQSQAASIDLVPFLVVPAGTHGTP